MNCELIYILLGVVGTISSTTPFFLFIFLFTRFDNKKVKWQVLVLSIEYIVINLICITLIITIDLNLKILYNLHDLFELFIYTSLYFSFKPDKKFKIYFILLLIFGLLSLFYLFHQNFSVDWTNYISVVSNIVLISLSLNYILSEYNFSQLDYLTDNGYFVISAGVLFFSGIQFYFSINESLFQTGSLNLHYALWPIFQLGGIIYYTIFSFGIWKLKNS